MKEHAVAVHSFMVMQPKISVEWCLYLVPGVTEMIWHCKCICYT